MGKLTKTHCKGAYIGMREIRVDFRNLLYWTGYSYQHSYWKQLEMDVAFKSYLKYLKI